MQRLGVMLLKTFLSNKSPLSKKGKRPAIIKEKSDGRLIIRKPLQMHQYRHRT
jgi:hypothetical protein